MRVLIFIMLLFLVSCSDAPPEYCDFAVKDNVIIKIGNREGIIIYQSSGCRFYVRYLNGKGEYQETTFHQYELIKK